MDAKLVVNNVPLVMPTHFTIGSFTTGNFEVPQGQVMRLTVGKLAEVQPEEPEQKAPPVFGAHIREGIAVVKDWMKKP